MRKRVHKQKEETKKKKVYYCSYPFLANKSEAMTSNALLVEWMVSLVSSSCNIAQKVQPMPSCEGSCINKQNCYFLLSFFIYHTSQQFFTADNWNKHILKNKLSQNYVLS
jgi:hypothetical protein